MLAICLVCGEKFQVGHRGKFHDLIPHVCSGPCFRRMLTTDGPEFSYTEIGADPEVIAYPKEQRRDELRSGYERRFVEWLSQNGVKFKYEPYTFKLMDDLWYLPDFLIKGGTFLEVKGLYNSRDAKKIELFTKKYQYPFYLIDYQFITMIRRRAQA